MRSTIALDLALTLILARLAGGVSGVALKLALGLKRCFSGDLLGMLDLTRDCLCLQSLLPGDFLSRQLRSLLGFRGLLVSDDLGMKAVADRYSIEELAVGAIDAGCDHLLIREPEARQIAAHEAIVRAAEARAGFRARVEESAARVATLKAACQVAMPAPAAMLPSLLGTPAHRALAGSFGAVPSSPAGSSPVSDG